MSENKNEATNENFKNARKHWPQELKDGIYGKIVGLKKDPQGRTIYVKTNDDGNEREFHIGYNSDGTVNTVMNVYDRADKKPATYVNTYGINGRTTFQ